MPINSAQYPSLPEDTARAAKSVFNIENLYMIIGDQLDCILSEIDLAALNDCSDKPVSLLITLALVAIFQFAEDMPDRRAAEATRNRMDWKYALHLPLIHPGIDASFFCEFRRELGRNPACQQVFQKLLERFVPIGLLGSRDKRKASSVEVLASICRLSRLERIGEAVCQALEAIAAARPEWLRAVALAHWYERYKQGGIGIRFPSTSEKQKALANALGSDCHYLLEVISEAGVQELADLPEISWLQRVWREQYDLKEGVAFWKEEACSSCQVASSQKLLIDRSGNAT